MAGTGQIFMTNFETDNVHARSGTVTVENNEYSDTCAERCCSKPICFRVSLTILLVALVCLVVVVIVLLVTGFCHKQTSAATEVCKENCRSGFGLEFRNFSLEINLKSQF